MPSNKVLEQKKAAVAQIKEKLSTAASGVFVDYRGLTVSEDTELRNKFRAAGVEYRVVKNTLTRFAALELGLNELDEILNGPTSLALSYEDPVAPAKIVADFIKANDGKIAIKSGFMDGKVISIDEIKTLANTPSKEVLIAKLMGSLNSPISALARLLNTIVEGGVELADLAANNKADAPAEEEKAEAAPAEEPKEEVKEEAKAEEPAEEAPAEEPKEEATKEAATEE